MDKKYLAEEQIKCINTVVNLYNAGQDIITIAGPAGSGKTSIVNSIIEELGLKNTQIEFVAYTGKAAQVLQLKGIPANTIHSLIYNCVKDEKTNKYYFIKKKELDNYNCKLIVIDEVSMVGETLLKDLKSFYIPILCLGDPYQLEPVLDDKTDLLKTPDFLLKEIHRQSDDNTIIDFSFDIRSKKTLKCNYNDNHIRPISSKELDSSMLLWADQVLCSTNKVKASLNNTIRKVMGFTDRIPQIGDKLICKRNYKNINSEIKNNMLVNGTIGFITNILGVYQNGYNNYMDIEFRPDWDKSDFFMIRIDLNPFLDFAPYSDIKKKYSFFTIPRVSVDFGYAITIHKSQGSEWEKVLIYSVDAFGDVYKLLYTAVTRAREKILYVQ